MPFLRTFWVSFLLIGSVTAGEWVLPWLSNRDGEWASSVTFNNHGEAPASLQLTAVRANGDTFTANLDAVVAGGQVIRTVGDLFPDLGSGGGFALFAVSESDAWTISAKVASLNTASGDSPAIAEAVSATRADTRLVFPSLPYMFGANTALVLVNMGDEPQDIVLQVFTEQGFVWATNPIRLEPRRPLPQLMALVLPELTVSSYITVVGAQSMIGGVFNFNTLNEPSLMNALPNPAVNSAQLDELVMTMNSSAEIIAAYGTATSVVFNKNETPKREDCPAVETTFNPAQSESFLAATLDWGAGCTNMLGVYHAGALGLSLSRDGGVSAAWMAGQLNFNQFVTRYQGEEFRINGTVQAEGSTLSANFQLNGAWQAEALSAFASGDVAASVNLAVSRREAGFTVQGAYQTQINGASHYDITAVIEAGDPLFYDFTTCAWPTRGTVLFQLYSNAGFSGSLNYNTGDCNTAVLTIAGKSETITLGSGG